MYKGFGNMNQGKWFIIPLNEGDGILKELRASSCPHRFTVDGPPSTLFFKGTPIERIEFSSHEEVNSFVRKNFPQYAP